MDFNRIDSILEDYREKGYYPSAVCEIFDKEKTLYHKAFGDAAPDTWFDLASVSKIICTTMLLSVMEEGRLSPENLAIYESCFDRAEAAVANQPEFLQRVKIARQPLRYAELEQTKLDPYGPNGIYVQTTDSVWETNPEYTQKLEDFIALCKQEGVTRLSEWHTTPDEYLDMMRKISIVRQDGNLSFEKPVALSPAPHPKYDRSADKVLTNGIHGSNDYKIQWLGWDVPRFEAVVDLGSEQEIARVTATYLQVLTDWIFFPKQVTFYVSSDGKDYAQAGMEAQPEVNRAVAIGSRDFSSAVGRKGRYVKVVTDGVGICPPWHLGAGKKAFAFMDEIVVE